MARFLVRWLALAVGIYAAVAIVPGITVRSTATLAVAALGLGFVNAVVRPVLVVLTLPLTFLTLGLFYFVVNGLAFWLAAALVPGFSVASLGSAIMGAFVASVISWAMGGLLGPSSEPAPR